MLQRIPRMKVTRWVASFLIVSLTLTLGYINFPLKALARQEMPNISIAAVGIENLTKYALMEEDHGIDMLLAEISGLEGVEIVPQNRVVAALGKNAPNPDVAISVGRAVGSEAVLVGFVSNLEFDGTEMASVEVGLSLYNTEDGRLLSEAVVVGRSSRLGFSGSKFELAELAIRDGVRTATGFVLGNLTTFGVVTMVKGQDVFCNLAERDQVRNGAEIAIFKKNTNMQIASIEVDEVSIAHSKGAIIQQQKGLTVEVGDQVRLVYTPVVIEFTGGMKKVPKKKKFSPLLLGVLAVGVIAAVSRGGNKAEPPNTTDSYAVKASSDGLAAVYSPNPWHTDYVPKQPIKITESQILSTDLADCWNSNSFINPLEDTIYNFTLASSPKNPTLPGDGYTIAFDLEHLIGATDGFESDETADLKCATCNTDLNEWEIISGTYQKISYLNNNYGITCKASHFTPYLVILDERQDPCPAPQSVSAECADGSATVSWETIPTTTECTNTGYSIYSCTSTSCTSIIDTISDPTDTSETYSYPNGTQVCFAVEGIPSISSQDATRSSIVCTTPSSDPKACQVHAITLVSPASGASINYTPTFIFIGAGDMDYYMVKMWDLADSTILMDKKQTGEGAESETRETFEVQFSGDSSGLSNGHTYQWKVTGYQDAGGSPLTSSTWSFTYVSDDDDDEDCEMETTPDCMQPTNGTSLKDASPLLIWSAVECADEYLVTVFDNNGYLVSDISLVADDHTNYSGTALEDDVDYQWTVRAHDGKGTWVMGDVCTFTKVAEDPIVSDLPIPNWVSGDGKLALTGGDQLVSLNWERVEDTRVIGYAIYRSDSPGSGYSKIDTVYKSQLDDPLPSEDCPTQFSENNPGYCDISVINGEHYYYKLASVQQGGSVSDLSVLQHILLGLERPELISPGDVVATEVTTSYPEFRWFPINGIDVQYIIKVIDNTSSTETYQATVSNTYVSYPDEDGVPSLANGNTYRWYVKAFNDNGVESENSTEFRFTKVESSEKPDAPNFCGGTYCAPQQSDPYDVDYSNTSITLYWEKPNSENIQYFNVYRCENTSGVCYDVTSTSTNPSAIAENSSCTSLLSNVVCFEDTYLDRGSTYYYNITAVDSGGTESLPSTTLSVKLNLQGPVLVFPYYDQVIYQPQPELTWYGESGATLYYVQVVKKPDTFSNAANFVWSIQMDGSGTSLHSVTYNSDDTAKSPLLNPADPSISGNQYQWRVCSMNERNTTPACSNPSQFYKNLKPPTTISPDSGDKVAVDSINFTWTETPGAAGYTVRACKREGTGTDCRSLPIMFQVETTNNYYTVDVSEWDKCDLTTDSTCATDGAYFWEVRAYDEYNAVSGSWDNVNRELFYVVFGESPSLVTPLDGSILMPDSNSPEGTDFYGNPTYCYDIEFQWVDIGESGYIFRIEDIEASDDSSNPDDPNIVVVYQTTVSGTDLTLDSCEFGIDLAAGHRHRWNVAPTATPFDTANAREFTTGLPYPNLIAPEHGTQVMLQDNCDGQSSTLCLYFDWDGGTFDDVGTLTGVIGALSYDIEILKNGGSPFLCEIGFSYDENNQADPPYTNTTNTFCNLSTDGTSAVHGDVFTWRVRARDGTGVLTQSGTGNPGPWSQLRQFTVLIPPPVLSVPPDSSAVCDPFNSPDTIYSECTVVDCLDMSFYWSPIPSAAGRSCYRIDISDTSDFRNIIWTDNTESPVNSFPCPLLQCYQAGTAEGQYIPMTNGVVYYWRVGASVVPSEGGQCGFTWIYSDIWEYFKRPPIPQSVSATPGIYTIDLSWSPPQNCTSGGQALSFPSVPPEGGEYVVYVRDEGDDTPDPTTTTPYQIVSESTTSIQVVGMEPDRGYQVCVAVVDDSFFINHAGHVSTPMCVGVTTLPEEDEG